MDDRQWDRTCANSCIASSSTDTMASAVAKTRCCHGHANEAAVARALTVLYKANSISHLDCVLFLPLELRTFPATSNLFFVTLNHCQMFLLRQGLVISKQPQYFGQDAESRMARTVGCILCSSAVSFFPTGWVYPAPRNRRYVAKRTVLCICTFHGHQPGTSQLNRDNYEHKHGAPTSPVSLEHDIF